MGYYRYVSQGEYYVTADKECTLVTSGMTECIAVSFIDRADPAKRLLAHIDGQILSGSENARRNFEIMIEAFKEKTGSADFDVHLLGGQKGFRNYRILMPVLEAAHVDVKQSVDIHEFCTHINQGRPKLQFFVPTSASATMICGPEHAPEMITWDNNAFHPPVSEADMERGKSLPSVGEQREQEEFLAINARILSEDPVASQRIRTCADSEWIAEHRISSDAPSSSAASMDDGLPPQIRL
jgi:hypothetical protein